MWWIAETVAEGEFVWPCVDGLGEEEETLMQCFIPLLKNVFSSFFLLFLTFFFSFYFSPPRTDSAATAAALALAGVGDEDLLGGLAALGPEGLDLEGSEVQTLREKVHYCCGSSYWTGLDR